MSAEQLAAYFDNADGSVPDAEVAAMLRKQAKAIQILRDAMNDIATCSNDLGAIECANEALAATENL